MNNISLAVSSVLRYSFSFFLMKNHLMLFFLINVYIKNENNKGAKRTGENKVFFFKIKFLTI